MLILQRTAAELLSLKILKGKENYVVVDIYFWLTMIFYKTCQDLPDAIFIYSQEFKTTLLFLKD